MTCGTKPAWGQRVTGSMAPNQTLSHVEPVDVISGLILQSERVPRAAGAGATTTVRPPGGPRPRRARRRPSLPYGSEPHPPLLVEKRTAWHLAPGRAARVEHTVRCRARIGGRTGVARRKRTARSAASWRPASGGGRPAGQAASGWAAGRRGSVEVGSRFEGKGRTASFIERGRPGTAEMCARPQRQAGNTRTSGSASVARRIGSSNPDGALLLPGVKQSTPQGEQRAGI
jgi:hypothetical protein